MCGIAALFSTRERLADRDGMLRACGQMANRGPDDSGVWTNPSGSVQLGHRRLSIIDLSPGGAQPMTVDGGRLAVVFNGEIYNHAALRESLEARRALESSQRVEGTVGGRGPAVPHDPAGSGVPRARRQGERGEPGRLRAGQSVPTAISTTTAK